MTHPNLDVLTRFFEAYSKRDMDRLREVTTQDIFWRFPGRNPLAGTKQGINEVVALFDQMRNFNFRPEKWITCANSSYVIEAQRVRGEQDGHDVELDWCVLWSFVDGKLAGGTHFSADQYKADDFFNRILGADG
jgi:ketosteroid isomerase-like protein